MSFDFKIHGVTTVWSKWQIVIPKSAREALDITYGDDVMLISHSHKWLMIIKTSEIAQTKDFVNMLTDEIKKHKKN